MKIQFKHILISLILLMVTACGQSQASATAQAATQQAALPQTLSLTQMLYGILTLEDTESAITAEQAKSLLFYWKGVKALKASDNVANEELAGLTEQIQEVFTTEQKSVIETMDLSPQSSRELFKYLQIDQSAVQGNEMQFNNSSGSPMGGNGNFTPPSGSQPRFERGDGEDIRGMMMGANGMNAAGSTTEQTQITKIQLPDVVIEAFIKFLQEKVSKG